MRTAQIPSIYQKSVSNLSLGLNAPFPFYLGDERKNFGLVTVISVFVTAFLYLFRTETEPQFPQNIQWLHGLITFATLLFNIILLPRILPVAMDPISWTFKKYIVLNVAHLALIAILCTLVEKPIYCPDKGWLEVGTHVTSQVALKGIIPILLTTLFLRAHMLQENLKEAIVTNQELERIHTLKKEQSRGANAVTLFSDTSESLSFNLPDLLFVEADDNYSTVVWRESGEVQRKLLRVNLKNVESQFNNAFTLRCHRSFIVNVNAISAISGNTNGYKLRIQDTDFSIPVSRPKGKEVMEKISQLRNLMELS